MFCVLAEFIIDMYSCPYSHKTRSINQYESSCKAKAVVNVHGVQRTKFHESGEYLVVLHNMKGIVCAQHTTINATPHTQVFQVKKTWLKACAFKVISIFHALFLCAT